MSIENTTSRLDILNVDYYFDGGTAKIMTGRGIYYFDRTMGGTYELYDKYPSEKGSKMIKDASLKSELVDSLTRFGQQSGVEKLIEDIISGKPEEVQSNSPSRKNIYAEMGRNPDGTPRE